MKALTRTVELATRLRGADFRAISVQDLGDVLKELLHDHQPIGYATDYHQIWLRGRICDSADGFGNVREMLYPPVTREFGRANIIGRSAFYASWNELTVLNEIAAQTGHHVQMVAVRARPDVQVPCSIFGELTHLLNAGRIRLNAPALQTALYNDLGKYDQEGQYRMFFLDAFISDEFRKVRLKPVEYKLTATIAEIFYPAGGLMYPSVEAWGAQNLAVPADVFDSSFEVLWTEVIRIDKYHGYGVYEASRTKFCCDFGVEGNINWNSTKTIDFRLGRFKERFPPPSYMGWQVPKPKA